MALSLRQALRRRQLSVSQVRLTNDLPYVPIHLYSEITSFDPQASSYMTALS